MFGITEDEVLQMRPWLDDFFTREPASEGFEPPHVAAMAKLRGALDDLATARGEHPGDDLISAMIAAEDEGARLSHEQVVVTTMTFLTAGFESTNNLLTNIAHVAQNEACSRPSRPTPARSPPSPRARWDSAAQASFAAPPATSSSTAEPSPPAQVLVHIGSANRDERQFPDPTPSSSTAPTPAASRSATAPTSASARRRPDAGPHLVEELLAVADRGNPTTPPPAG
jgi:hypothetical protein